MWNINTKQTNNTENILTNAKQNTLYNGSGFLAKIKQDSEENALKKQYQAIYEKQQAEKSQNNGGFLGGLGYLGEKIGLGFLQSIEGIWDFTAGGLAKLFGADDWAEAQFANDWVNYNDADEWYNPSDGWKTAGDIAGGIGSSLPNMAVLAGVGFATGGAGVPAALATFLTSGLSAAGISTKVAYQQTGELGAKEFGYGALSGITEGAIETFSDTVLGGVGGKLTKAFRKDLVSSAVRKSIGRELASSFFSEGLEEVASGFLEPYWKRMTYDPSAENASIQELAYAGFVGGMSGLIMSGTQVGVSKAHNIYFGNKAVTNNEVASVLNQAQSIVAHESTNTAESEYTQRISEATNELKTSLAATNGQVQTVRQKMLLGEVQQLNAAYVFTKPVVQSAENIYANADVLAERINEYGYKDADGNPIIVTAEQLREGIDATDSRTFGKTLKEALKKNSALRTLAVLDSTGQMFMDTAKYKESVLKGRALGSQVDLNRFIEQSSDSEKAAVAEKLGISDWNTLTNEELQQKLGDFVYNGGVEEQQQNDALTRELQNLDATSAAVLPTNINKQQDGAMRYSLGNSSVAVIRNGENFKIFDYSTGKLSKTLTAAEANRALLEAKREMARQTQNSMQNVQTVQTSDNAQQTQNIAQNVAETASQTQDATVEQTVEQSTTETEFARQAREIDAYCRTNIKDYSKLGESAQSMIRAVIRNGRAAGVDESFLLSAARISAHSGLNVVFSKEMSFVKANGTYADGAIDLKQNRIIINPEAKTRTGEMILIHELTHAIYNQDGVLTVAEGVETMTETEREKIRKRYSAVVKGLSSSLVISDEINAHFAENTLTNVNILERLLQTKPTLKERILSFFNRSSIDYAQDERLTGAAKKLYKQYNKLFEEFSTRNQGTNATERNKSEQSRYALVNTLKKLGEYDSIRKQHIENGENDRVSRNYDEIMQFVAESRKSPTAKRLHIGIVSDETAKLVFDKTGIDISDFDFVLSSNDIAHIFNKHGNEATESQLGQCAVTENDFENIIETVISPDDVSSSLSHNNVSALKFTKNLNGKNIAITIVSNKKSTLTLKSAWIIESGRRAPSTNAEALARTSKTNSGKPTTNSISETSKKVNTKTKISSLDDIKAKYKAQTDQLSLTEKEKYITIHNLIVKQNLRNGGVGQSILDDIISYADDKEKTITLTPTAEYGTQNRLKAWYKKNGFVENKGKNTDFTISDTMYRLPHGISLKESYKRYALDDSDGTVYTSNVETKEGLSDSTLKFLNEQKTIKVYRAMQIIDGELYPPMATRVKDESGKKQLVTSSKLGAWEQSVERPELIKNGKFELDKANGSSITAAYNPYFHTSLSPLNDQFSSAYKRDNLVVVEGEVPVSELTSGYKARYAKDAVGETQWHSGVVSSKLKGEKARRVILSRWFKPVRIMEDSEVAKIIAKTLDGENIDIPYNVVTPKLRAALEQEGVKIKYALPIGDESVPVSVERTKNLVALHNLSEDKLLRVLDLGGFPMPSIAVTTADLAHEQYGDITVVFGKETIDPESDSRNVVYDRDAWTPTAPTVEIKLDADKVEALTDDLKKNVGNNSAYKQDIDRFFDGEYRNNKGEYVVSEHKYTKNYFGEKAIRNSGIVAAYLGEKGINIEPVYAERGFTMGWTSYTRQEAADLLNYVGITKDITRYNVTAQQRSEILEKYIEHTAHRRGVFLKKRNPNITNQEIVDMIKNDYDDGNVSQLLFLAEDFYNESRPKDVYDEHSTLDKMRSEIKNEKDFYEWIWNKIEATFERKGIDNDSDVFDSRGNRRSFEQRHYAYTLENIVKAMSKGDQEGNIPLGMSAGALAAKLSKQFESIEDIRDAQQYLSRISEEDLKAFNTKTYELYDEIVTQIAGETSDFSNDFNRREDIGNILGKCAAVKPLNVENIKRVFAKETKGYESLHYRFNDQIAEKTLSLFETLKHVPTTYFEAKPRRAVGFNEVKMVLLPETASDKLKLRLDSKKVPYQVYGSDENARAKAVRSLDNIRFALPETDSQGSTLSAEQREFFADSKVVDEKGRLKAVYHGTTADFTIFARGDVGFHFGTYRQAKNRIYGASGKHYTIKAYLNITNPLEIESDYGSWQGNNVAQMLVENEVFEGQDDVNARLSKIGKMSEREGSRALRVYLQELGYDGIRYLNTFESDYGESKYSYIAFRTEQIKLTANTKPTSNADIRFALSSDEDSSTRGGLSKGQRAKFVANNTGYKFYTKAEAESVINSIMSERMEVDERYFGEIDSKTKAQAVDYLFQKLNNTPQNRQLAVALKLADYIIDNAVLTDIYESDVDNSHQVQLLNVLRSQMHRFNLEGIKADIKYRYDKKMPSIYSVWGAKKGTKGVTADVVMQDVLSQYGIRTEAVNEADIFFEIVDLYESTRDSLNKKVEKMKLSAYEGAKNLEKRRQEIARDILLAYDEKGEKSKFAKLVEKYTTQIKQLTAKVKDAERHNYVTNRLLYKTQKIRDWKTGAFVNHAKFRTQLFSGSIEKLGQIKNRGNLNRNGTRRIVAGLAAWYTTFNPVLGYESATQTGLYNQEIADILHSVAQNQKPLTDAESETISRLQAQSGITDYFELKEWYTKENLKGAYNAETKQLLRDLSAETTFTTEELVALEKAVDHFAHIIQNYNKVLRNGKYVDAEPIAQRYIEVIHGNQDLKLGLLHRAFNKVFDNTRASYMQTFSDPMAYWRYKDGYQNGFYTEMGMELRKGEIAAASTELDIREPLEEFLNNHKKYAREVSKRTVTYGTHQMPAQQAFLLYMTLNREQALKGLAEAGFVYNDGKQNIRVDGFARGNFTLDELRTMARQKQEELYAQFTETDKEYIAIAEQIFNESCKNAKRETDILRQGYSNVIDGYYVPIRRANTAKTVDANMTFFDEMNRVSNASFNKDTVQGARGEITIEGLDDVLDRHIHAISQYAGLATVIDQYDIIYNLNTGDNANKPVTVATESANTWGDGDVYMRKIISDIQGISPVRGGVSKVFSFLRSGYAKYQLGANPKVLVTQFSSLFAASSRLDYSSIIKGSGINANDVDEYCSLAKIRNSDNTAAMAQGVIDKVGTVGDFLMKPIGKVDRFVVKKLFGACQIQVEKEKGLKVGTKENKIEAGNLLESVILETQQNSMATERSAAMRGGSEMMRTLTMFTADSMKVFARVMDAIGEISVLRARIKATTDATIKADLQTQLKQAMTKARKAVTSLTASAIFMALVAEAFRWLYNKDRDEDENIVETMTVDAIGNMFGGLPLIKDLYAKLAEGYDLTDYSYSAINDLFDSFSSLVNSTSKPAQKTKDVINAVGQMFGLPTRNIYNIIYGLTKRVSPTAAYQIDTAFYNQSYSSDLKEAIENEDDAMIATIVGIMLNERVGGTSEAVRAQLNDLTTKGYSVLPRSISSTITYDGEEITMSTEQLSQFRSIYSQSMTTIDKMLSNKTFIGLDDELKAKAIKQVYDAYYNKALEETFDVSLDNKLLLASSAISLEKLSPVLAAMSVLESDKDSDGKTVTNSKKKKVITLLLQQKSLSDGERLLLLYYKGYTLKDKEYKNMTATAARKVLLKYILKLNVSKDIKAQLAEMCDFEVKNGKIMASSI